MTLSLRLLSFSHPVLSSVNSRMNSRMTAVSEYKSAGLALLVEVMAVLDVNFCAAAYCT